MNDVFSKLEAGGQYLSVAGGQHAKIKKNKLNQTHTSTYVD